MVQNAPNEQYRNAYLPPMRIYMVVVTRQFPPDGSVDFVRELERLRSGPGFMYTKDGVTQSQFWRGPMDADHRFHRDGLQSGRRQP
jgi:hypothetical protein